MKDLIKAIQNDSFKAAVFDIDGTLIDSMPIWEDLDAEFLKTQGIELSEQEKQELNATMWTMTVDEGIRYLKETYALSLPEEAIRKALDDVIEHFYVYEVPAKPGMRELVEALHDAGVPMALATVGAPAHETAALKRLGLLDYFESMYDCNSLGTTKRDAVIYETAAKALLGSGFEPARVLVVEDVLHALIAAKEAGFTTVAVEDDASVKDKDAIRAAADYYIHK